MSKLEQNTQSGDRQIQERRLEKGKNRSLHLVPVPLGDGDNSEVILLPKLLGSFNDACSGLRGDLASRSKPKS